MEKSYEVRVMKPGEVDLALSWAEQEGWNPGIHDGECFYRIDPSGFFIAETGGKPVATAVVANYSSEFSFGGLFIVHPEYRGKGAGTCISRHAMAHAGTRNLGIDGVLAMQPKYAERDGFIFAYRNKRFEGRGGGDVPEGLVPGREVSFREIDRFDRDHFPAPRSPFLEAWLSQADSRTLVEFGKDGSVAGFGTIRTCFSGFKIGPLFAGGPEAADRLYRGLAAYAPGLPVFLDVPEPNRDGILLAARYGMELVFETARMYTRNVPDLPLREIFGVTSFEMG
ncbi:GNAT superfamily N-acetyltransferase [Methanolinea mesophila]|uniref:GNAT family N-acetyltransferase n=1 Tax=Methanolinea mesophila TaxID=547055 RepID=UPI001AE1F328|nr:GNAT family N-acetyltransferase [Methanolinea mesophila]MBP1928612.1 GNAT superfamily N-acetyltransferase [Methanolinea mesophila]